MADFSARPAPAPAGASTCPDCGSAVRPGQEWCTLCLRVLIEPTLPPARIPSAAPVVPASAGAAPAAAVLAPDAAPDGPTGRALTPEGEAAAAALLEQLAADSRREGLQLPSYLSTNARRMAAAAVAMVVLCGAVLLVMTVLGAIF